MLQNYEHAVKVIDGPFNGFTGVIEENEIFHVMGRALGLIPAPVAE